MVNIISAGGRMLWESEHQSGGAIAHTSQVISSASQKVAGVFRAPKTGTLERIAFQCLAVSGSPVLYARLESLGSDWKPSGTIIAAGASGTATPTVGANTIYLGTPYAATVNELIAAVVGYSSGATSATISVRATGPYGRTLPAHCLDTGTGYSVPSGRPAVMAVYDSNEYAALAHVVCDGFNTGMGTASSPNERGNKLTPLFDYTCVGVNANLRDNGSASCDVCLYDSGGTLLRSISHTPASTATTNPFIETLYWNSPVTLTAGQTYYLTIKAVSGTCTVVSAGYNSAFGREAVTKEAWQAVRTSGGAWTEDSASLVALVPLVTDISGGGGGSAGFPLSRIVN